MQFVELRMKVKIRFGFTTLVSTSCDMAYFESRNRKNSEVKGTVANTT